MTENRFEKWGDTWCDAPAGCVAPCNQASHPSASHALHATHQGGNSPVQTASETQAATAFHRALNVPRRVRLTEDAATGREAEQESLLQLADRLARLDLSHESATRQQLRTRLVAQAERRAFWDWPWQLLLRLRPQPMLALVAAGVLLLAAVACPPTTGWRAGVYNGAMFISSGAAGRLQTQQPAGVVADRPDQGQAVLLVALADVRNPAPAGFAAADYDLVPRTTPSIFGAYHEVDLPTPAPVPAPPE